MSMVGTYVLADNDKWYADPTIRQGQDWFICFDDDDPIELVIADDYNVKPDRVLKYAGIDGKVTSRRGHHSMRIFDPAGFAFKDATAYWIRINKPIPADKIAEHDGEYLLAPHRQGVFYHFDKKDWTPDERPRL